MKENDTFARATSILFVLFVVGMFTVVGSVFLTVAGSIEYKLYQIRSNSVKAELTVLKVDSKPGKENGRVYRPTFSTRGQDGTLVQYRGNMWHSPQPHKTGAVVQGWYNPKTGHLVSARMMRSETYFARAIFVIIAIITVFVFFWVKGFWKSSKQEWANQSLASKAQIKNKDQADYFKLATGALFTAIGFWTFSKGALTEANSIKAKLQVIEVQEKQSDNKTVYKPTFSTIAEDGSTVVYSGSTWTSPKPHRVGEVVDGWYDVETEKLVSEKLVEQSKSLGRLLGSTGIGVLLWSAFTFFRRRNKDAAVK